jgi:four helix bundle protein
MKPRNYKHLIVWQKSVDLSLLVYRKTESFPTSELFGLVSQMRRSAISIPSNVAEGNKRGTDKEYRKFIQISLGSGAELETQRIIASGLGYIDGKDGAELSESIEEVMRLLGGLEKAISDRICESKHIAVRPDS